jgi:hypothetical protein
MSPNKRMKYTIVELNELPLELITNILEFTGGLFVLTTANKVCKQWNLCVHTDTSVLWKKLFQQQFPWVNICDTNYYDEFLVRAKQVLQHRIDIVRHAKKVPSISKEFIQELISDKWMRDYRFIFGHQLELYCKIMSEDKIPVGYSKTGGTPDLPLNYKLPIGVQFFLQINLSHLSFYTEAGVPLPSDGMLYIFLTTESRQDTKQTIFHISAQKINQAGGLVRTKSDSQSDEHEDEQDAVFVSQLDFEYVFTYPSNLSIIDDKIYPELTQDQLSFIQSVRLDCLRESHPFFKKFHFTLFGHGIPECHENLYFQDNYIYEANFNQMKVVPHTEFIGSATASERLQEYNSKHPDDQYDIVFKAINSNVGNTGSKLIHIDRETLHVSYEFTSTQHLLSPKNSMFLLVTDTNDRIENEDLLLLKQCIYDQCVNRESEVRIKREEASKQEAKLERKQIQQMDIIIDDRIDTVTGFGALQHGLFTNSSPRMINWPPVQNNVYYSSEFDDLLYCKDPDWYAEISKFCHSFSAEDVSETLYGHQCWEFYFRKKAYLRDDGTYDISSIQLDRRCD